MIKVIIVTIVFLVLLGSTIWNVHLFFGSDAPTYLKYLVSAFICGLGTHNLSKVNL